MNRGDIYYIRKSAASTGNEIACEKARPAVVVSNNNLNHHAGVVEVVFLTSQPKREMPTHARVMCKDVKSTALCEQVNTVAVQRVGDYAGTCTEEEMAAIDKALLASLGIGEQIDTKPQPIEVIEPSAREKCLLAELSEALTERDRYAKMVDVMLSVTEV